MIPPGRPTAGLCETCEHRRDVANRRGSVFLFCEKSQEDPRFPKYPPLPVLACAGYRPGVRTEGPQA